MNKRNTYRDDLNFVVAAMSKHELAMLYAPNLTPHAAVNRLMNWINLHPTLSSELPKTGYRKTSKLFSPQQVALIVEYLGEP